MFMPCGAFCRPARFTQAVFQTLCTSEFTRLPKIGKGLILTVQRNTHTHHSGRSKGPVGQRFPRCRNKSPGQDSGQQPPGDV